MLNEPRRGWFSRPRNAEDVAEPHDHGTAGEAEAHVGLNRVGCFHLNDSRFSLGSRRDRHANLGEGEIGLPALARLASDPRFEGTPMLLETPHGEDYAELKEDLGRLRHALT